MSTWGKGLSQVAAVLAIFALVAGCTGSQPSASSGAKPTGGEETAGTLKIGQVAPLTGFIAEYGQDQVRGVNLAVKLTNDAGGLEVNGKRYMLKVTTYDDKCEPTEAVNATQRLMDEGVVAVIGSVCSSNTLAMRALIDRAKRILVTTASTAPEITEPGHQYMFRTLGHIGLMADPLVGYGVKTLGLKKFGFLAINNDFGRSAVKFYGGKITDLGATLIEPQYYAAGDTNFYAQIGKIKAEQPDAIFIASGAAEGAAIVKQLSENGLNVPIVAHGLGTEQFLKLAGKELVDGRVYGVQAFVFSELEKSTKDFITQHADAFRTPPAEVVVYSYDAAMALMMAAKKAGTVTDVAKIRDALAGLTVAEYKPLTAVIPSNGGKIFNENGQVIPQYVVSVWKNGEYVVVK